MSRLGHALARVLLARGSKDVQSTEEPAATRRPPGGVHILAPVLLAGLFVACGSGRGTPELPVPTGSYEPGSVTAVLLGDGRFDAVVAMMEAASVVQGAPGAQDELGNAAEIASQPDWDHTIFAPTNAAFSNLHPDTIDCMFDEANATQSVRVHVVPEVVTSSEFTTGETVTIGGRYPMTLTEDGASFAGAEIVEADLEASNGVIHVLDSVNIPASCQPED